MPTRTYQKRKNKNNSASSSINNKPNPSNPSNSSNPSNLSSYEFEYRENKHPEYQYISDDSRTKITTRKERSEVRRERHREEDDKFHIGLLFGCLVLSYLLNFAYGFQAGTTMYGVVFTIGLVIWIVVALMIYFREGKE